MHINKQDSQLVWTGADYGDTVCMSVSIVYLILYLVTVQQTWRTD